MVLSKNFQIPTLKYLLEGGASGCIILDNELKIQYANPAISTISGLNQNELKRLSVQEFFSVFPADPKFEQILSSLRDATKAQTRGSFPITVPQKTLGTRSYQIEVAQLAGDANDAHGFILIFKPNQAEPGGSSSASAQRSHRSLEAERFAQSTIDALPSHICVLDENGTIIATNRAWRNFAETNEATDPDHYIGVNYLEVCDAAQGTDSDGAPEFAEGIRSVMRGECKHFSLEYTCDSPWENRWFIGNVTRFGNNTPLRLVISHVNITERKQVEEELSKQKEILQTIIEDIPIMIVFIDKDGDIKQANRAWENTLGWKVEEIQKQNLDILSELYPDPQYRQGVLNFINSAQMKWAEFKTRVRDGRTINTYWANVKLTDGTNIGFGQDITERKRAYDDLKHRSDELARSNALISALSKVAGQLLKSLDPDRVMQILLEELSQIGVSCVISLFDPEDGSFIIKHGTVKDEIVKQVRALTGLQIWGLQLSRQRLLSLTELIDEGAAIFLPDPLVTAASAFPDIPRELLKRGLELIGISKNTTIIGLPLFVENQILGTVTIWGEDLKENDLSMFSVFASQVSIALENARLFEQVRKGRENLQSLSRQLVDIQEMERQQIARELHDEIGQILTGLKLLMEMNQKLPPEKRDTNFAEAKDLVNNMMARIQEISLDLRPTMLDDLGLLPALLWHFNRFSAQTEVRVNFKHNGLEERRFSMALETAAYRIVQEALTNVARYAGVKTVDVRVWADNRHLHLKVEDHGEGFDLQAVLDSHATSGISGMHERAILCGGKLTINTTPGEGTKLYTIFPFSDHIERRSDERIDRAR